jgi:hypothetical protein
MAKIGKDPVGTTPVGATVVPNLQVENIDFYFEITEDDIVIPGNLWTKGLDLTWDDSAPAVTQDHTMITSNVEYNLELDDITITQTQGINIQDVDFRFDIEDPAVKQTQKLVSTNIDYAFEVDSPAVVQTHAIHPQGLEFSFDIPDSAVQQTHVITPGNIDWFFSIPNVWIFPPQECIGFDSTMEVDGGLLVDLLPDGTPNVNRWYTKDRYKFVIKWDHVARKTVLALEGFFRAFRYQEVLFYYPADKSYYQLVLADGVNAIQESHMDDWSVTLEMVGDYVGKYTPPQIQPYAASRNLPILNPQS